MTTINRTDTNKEVLKVSLIDFILNNERIDVIDFTFNKLINGGNSDDKQK